MANRVSMIWPYTRTQSFLNHLGDINLKIFKLKFLIGFIEYEHKLKINLTVMTYDLKLVQSAVVSTPFQYATIKYYWWAVWWSDVLNTFRCTYHKLKVTIHPGLLRTVPVYKCCSIVNVNSVPVYSQNCPRLDKLYGFSVYTHSTINMHKLHYSVLTNNTKSQWLRTTNIYQVKFSVAVLHGLA